MPTHTPVTRLDWIEHHCYRHEELDALGYEPDLSDSAESICRLLDEAAAESEDAHCQALAVVLNWGRFDVLGQSSAPRISVTKVVEAITEPACSRCGTGPLDHDPNCPLNDDPF